MAVLKLVQSDQGTLPAGSADIAITIDAVDMNSSILFVSCSPDENRPDRGLISWELTNSTTVTISRNASAGGAIALQWYVAEFISGVSVQRDTTTMDATTVDVPIATISLSESFVLASYQYVGGNVNSDDFVASKLETPTNMQLRMNSAGGSTALLRWQVVEFSGSIVQTNDIAFNSGETSKIATLTSAVNTGKSLLIFSYGSDNGTTANIGQKMVRGVITDPTTLTFDRDNTGQEIDLTWFLVEFTDQTTVQHGSQEFTNTELQKDVALTTPVLLANTVALAGAISHRGGKTSYSSDDNPGVGSVQCEVTSVANLQLTRSLHGSATCDIGWFVVQFATAVAAASLPPFRNNMKHLLVR